MIIYKALHHLCQVCKEWGNMWTWAWANRWVHGYGTEMLYTKQTHFSESTEKQCVSVFHSRLCYMSSGSVVSVFPSLNFQSLGRYIISAWPGTKDDSSAPENSVRRKIKCGGWVSRRTAPRQIKRQKKKEKKKDLKQRTILPMKIHHIHKREDDDTLKVGCFSQASALAC